MRRWGREVGFVAIVIAVGVALTGSPVPVGAAPGDPAVQAGCLGVDPGSSPQIRVGIVVDGADGQYRAVFGGPTGPVQGEGRVAGGRGLVIVPAPRGKYATLLVTDVDTGQVVDLGPLAGELPLTVGDASVACDPATLAVTSAPANGGATTTSPGPAVSALPGSGAPTTGISTVAPLATAAATTTTDAPPWLLLLVPGALLVIGGIVLLVRARSGSRSRRTT